ncbi:unnamed protein product [Meloidogyne enterolobii]|uniref:Uncharacterized protein n=1 Tax=Meloidogyne enterolobii TaxID=390850 RepID=A0ACB0XX84_MELEN
MRNELNKRIYNPEGFPLEKADPNENKILDRMFETNKKRRLNEAKGGKRRF